jgi:hypothetical protein
MMTTANFSDAVRGTSRAGRASPPRRRFPLDAVPCSWAAGGCWRGRSGRLGRGKRRGLLALLLIHANEVVSQDRLIEALWGERPPATPRTALQVLVSDLRKELGEEILLTRPSGYVLTAQPEDLDAAEFARLLDGGRRALTRPRACL